MNRLWIVVLHPNGEWSAETNQKHIAYGRSQAYPVIASSKEKAIARAMSSHSRSQRCSESAIKQNKKLRV